MLKVREWRLKDLNNRHKKWWIWIAIICVLLTGIFLWWLNARKPYIARVGETIVIDSKKEEEDRKKWLPTNACLFDGKIEITLLESKLYQDNEEAGILDIYMGSELENEEQFLLLMLEIHNMDAVPVFSEGFLSTSFSLIPYHEIDASVPLPKNMVSFNPDITYSSVFQESVENDKKILQQPKEGYYYKLSPGESKIIRIGFSVEKEAYENDQLVIKYSTGNDGPPKTIFLIK